MSTTLARMRCTHGMPSPASCVDCMDEGVFLPPQARRPAAGQLAAGTVALDNDCCVQAIAAATGADYLDAAGATWIGHVGGDCADDIGAGPLGVVKRYCEGRCTGPERDVARWRSRRGRLDAR